MLLSKPTYVAVFILSVHAFKPMILTLLALLFEHKLFKTAHIYVFVLRA